MATNFEMAAMLSAGYEQQSLAQGPGDLTFHMGVIQSWDEASGVNTVVVNGVPLSNLRTVQGGIGVLYQPQDVVALLRFQSTYFVMGRIGAPGAGNANQIRSNRVITLATVPVGGGFADIAGSFGPDLQDVYIGSSRRCLVIHSTEVLISGIVDVAQDGKTNQAVQVTGASNFAPATAVTDAYLSGIAGTQATVTATSLVTAADGLNQGFHRFTCKYKATADGSQTNQIHSRGLTVIPF